MSGFAKEICKRSAKNQLQFDTKNVYLIEDFADLLLIPFVKIAVGPIWTNITQFNCTQCTELTHPLAETGNYSNELVSFQSYRSVCPVT